MQTPTTSRQPVHMVHQPLTPAFLKSFAPLSADLVSDFLVVREVDNLLLSFKTPFPRPANHPECPHELGDLQIETQIYFLNVGNFLHKNKGGISE